MGTKPRAKPRPVAVTRAAADVDTYLSALPEPARALATELRALVRRALPQAEEGIKWNVPVFELEVPICYLAAHASYVRLGFYRGSELEDPRGLLEGTGARLRHVKVAVGTPLDRAGLEALVRRGAALATA